MDQYEINDISISTRSGTLGIVTQNIQPVHSYDN